MSRRVFITGGGGFIAGHLSTLLTQRGDDVFAPSRSACDIQRPAEVEQQVASIRPDWVVHLAAQSLIPASFQNPAETLAVNVLGTLHCLEAVRKVAPSATIVSVGSSAEYGSASGTSTWGEDQPVAPTSPYAVSKVQQAELARFYHRVHHLRIVHCRPFAIIGPGKIGDALSDFCARLVAFERTGDPGPFVLRVGNIDAARDFMDVRDCARAIVLLAEQGASGEIYNICTGVATPVSALVEHIKTASRRDLVVTREASRVRAVDDQRIVGNPARLEALGFSAEIPIRQTVVDVLSTHRSAVHPVDR